MKKYKIFLFLPIFLFSSCFDEKFEYKNASEDNFDALWEIIDTRYCYLDYKNIDWERIGNSYKARLPKATTDFELFDLFADMLAELEDGHVNLYSNFDISRYSKWYTDFPSNYSSSIISDHYLEKIRYAGGFRYGTIADGKIGYMYYGDFTNGFTDTNLKLIFNSFIDCDALIVDVRNNGGGSISYSEQLASYFFTEDIITGYFSHKTGPGHTQFSKPSELKTPASKTIRWEKPVAILSNRLSYSATNDFINRMKSASNAIIVGDKSGGGGGMPLSSELPNGWMVRFSACPMYDKNMQDTEFGIDPDFRIDMDQTKPTEDAIIDKAVEELRKMK